MAGYETRLREAWRGWELANDADLTGAELARRVGKRLKKNVDPATVSRWKAGLQEPSIAEYRAIGEELHADPAWLAFGPDCPRMVAERPSPYPVIQEQSEPLKRVPHKKPKRA